MEDRPLTQSQAVPVEVFGAPPASTIAAADANRSFDDRFVELFDVHYRKLFRYLDRLSGDPDLAADIAQDAFVRLYSRRSIPDTPGGWLISVAMNLFRNVRSGQTRRTRLLTAQRGTHAHADPEPSAHERVEADETRRTVQNALHRIPERERSMLLLRAEGYSYVDIGLALGIHEVSVGTLLARAKRAFREAYGEIVDAPG